MNHHLLNTSSLLVFKGSFTDGVYFRYIYLYLRYTVYVIHPVLVCVWTTAGWRFQADSESLSSSLLKSLILIQDFSEAQTELYFDLFIFLFLGDNSRLGQIDEHNNGFWQLVNNITPAPVFMWCLSARFERYGGESVWLSWRLTHSENINENNHHNLLSYVMFFYVLFTILHLYGFPSFL